MKILLAATPAAGHVNPLLGLTRMALDRGHEVVLATGTYLAPRVEAAGATFVPLLGDADIDFTRVEEALPGREALPPGPERMRFDMERAFIDPIPAQAETLRELIACHAPDVVATDAAFLGRAALVLDDSRSRPPMVAVNTCPLLLPRPDGAPFGPGLPPARSDEERARYAAMAREADAAVNDPVRAHLVRTLARAGATGEVSSLLDIMAGAADAYLQPTAPSFEYDFGPLPPTVRFVGALLQPPGVHPTRPDWWNRLDDARPIVLVTQGTVANCDFGELVNPALAAMAGRDDLQVVVSTGGRPVEDVEAPPGIHLFVAPFIDFVELMPRLAAVVTNGGYGAVTLALTAGVPVVATGRSEDKAEVGARVAWSGVGIQTASSPPTPAELREAIARVLAEPSFRSRAQAIAAEFAAIDTPREVFAVLDSLAARPVGGLLQ